MMTDPIADFLARIRNAHLAKQATVKVRSSKISRKLAEILQREGFIGGMEPLSGSDEHMLRLDLRYDFDSSPIIDGLKRVSKPGSRVYKSATELPVVRSGMGIAIVSTSKGIMTSDEAKKAKVGGEVMCSVW